MFEDSQLIDIDQAKQVLTHILHENCTFKNEYKAEPYVRKLLNRGQRSLLTQLRSGILPLKIKNWRYQNISREFR